MTDYAALLTSLGFALAAPPDASGDTVTAWLRHFPDRMPLKGLREARLVVVRQGHSPMPHFVFQYLPAAGEPALSSEVEP